MPLDEYPTTVKQVCVMLYNQLSSNNPTRFDIARYMASEFFFPRIATIVQTDGDDDY